MHLSRLIIAFAFVVASGIPGLASAQGFSRNIDRPGGDYLNFALDGDASTCRLACDRDRQCRAWTFVKGGIQGPLARCWLKNVVPAPRANPCCTSGVTGGQRID